MSRAVIRANHPTDSATNPAIAATRRVTYTGVPMDGTVSNNRATTPTPLRRTAAVSCRHRRRRFLLAADQLDFHEFASFALKDELPERYPLGMADLARNSLAIHLDPETAK